MRPEKSTRLPLRLPRKPRGGVERSGGLWENLWVISKSEKGREKEEYTGLAARFFGGMCVCVCALCVFGGRLGFEDSLS